MYEPLSNPDLPFPDLSIQGFRGFQRLSISQLGRVTLITGKNNTGKSSILEALRLHTQNAAPDVIYSILTSREEYVRGMEEDAHFSDPQRGFHVSALFHGFPNLYDDFGPIVIATRGRFQPAELVLRIEWIAENDDPEGERRLLAKSEALIEEIPATPALVVRTEERQYVRRLENLHRYRYPRRLPQTSDRARMRCKVVTTQGGGSDTMGNMWDEATLRGDEAEVVKALQIIAPNITAVWTIGGERMSNPKTAFVRAGNFERPVPLRSFGDGLNRLFIIILSLLDARGGILLIDEFENGLHHTVQLDAWRTVFQLAQNLNIQVFATSHSWDAVEAFQRATTETPGVGVLLRLARRGDDIIPTTFVEQELAVATRDQIELR